MNKYQKYSASEKGRIRDKKYKDKNRGKVMAQNQARHTHPIVQECSIKGCSGEGERHHPDYGKAIEIIWLCRKHHLAIHGKVRGICTICGLPQDSKGLCKKHYARKYRKEQGW